MTEKLLQKILEKLDRGDAPASRYPNSKGEYSALCPYHEDRHTGNFFVSRRGFQCFSCGEKGSLPKLAKKLGIKEESPTTIGKISGLTLEAYAEAKHLDLQFLKDLGISQRNQDGSPYLKIPYYNNENNIVAERKRYGGSGENKFRWRTGDKSFPYGLWKLDELVHGCIAFGGNTKYIFLVEGESDAQTLWSYDIPALGIPGATTWKPEWAKYVEKFDKVYVWQEPDQGGETFVEHICKSLPSAMVIRAPSGRKDISACHVLGDEIPELLRTLVQQAVSYQQIVDASLNTPNNSNRSESLTKIYTYDRKYSDISKEVLGALEKANDSDPFIFIRSGKLVQIVYDEKYRPSIQLINADLLRGILDRQLDFLQDARGRVVAPPEKVVKDILSFGEWKFPKLEGIVESPVLRPDGSVITKKGYDIPTGFYYIPGSSLKMNVIPLHPKEEQVDQAKAILQDLLVDFPFIDNASRANYIALLLTPIVRPAISETSPLALIDATQAGTGKTYLSRIPALIATGEEPIIITPPRDPDEWRKKVTSSLLVGSHVIVIDNMVAELSSEILASALTSPIWNDRLLSTNETIRLPQNVTWIANGNNIHLGGDMPRRCYPIRLDAKTSQPWNRDNFSRADILGWVNSNRAQLVWALLVLARAYFASGSPGYSGPVIGGFSSWSRIIGGILENAGIEGFLTNLQNMYENADQEGLSWESFLITLDDLVHNQKVTSAKICELIKHHSVLQNVLPDELGNPFGYDGQITEQFKQKLGREFGKRVRTRFGTSQIYIEQERDPRTRASLWRIIRGAAEACGGSFDPSENIIESKHQGEIASETSGASVLPYQPSRDLFLELQPALPLKGAEAQTEMGSADLELSDQRRGMVRYPDTSRPCISCGKMAWRERPEEQGGGFYCGYCHPDV